MQSLTKAIPASSRCRLPAKAKQSLDGAEQLLCLRLSQFRKTPGAFFGNFFPPFFPLPILFGVSEEEEEQPVTLSWTLPDVAATSGYKPSLGKAVLREYQPSSIFCTGNNDCCKPGSCRVSLQTSSGGDAVICSRLGSAWDGKSQRELAGK